MWRDRSEVEKANSACPTEFIKVGMKLKSSAAPDRLRSQVTFLCVSSDVVYRSLQGHSPGDTGLGAGVGSSRLVRDEGWGAALQWPQQPKAWDFSTFSSLAEAVGWKMQHHPGGSTRLRLHAKTKHRTTRKRMGTRWNNRGTLGLYLTIQEVVHSCSWRLTARDLGSALLRSVSEPSSLVHGRSVSSEVADVLTSNMPTWATTSSGW